MSLLHSPAAQSDLIGYYQDRAQRLGEGEALKVLRSFMGQCEDLARFPDMGRRYPELDALGVQMYGISFDGQLIVYVKRGGALHVVRILRDRRAA